jgi:hypothetical protein
VKWPDCSELKILNNLVKGTTDLKKTYFKVLARENQTNCTAVAIANEPSDVERSFVPAKRAQSRSQALILGYFGSF